VSLFVRDGDLYGSGQDHVQVTRGIVAMEHDLVARKTSRAKMSDELFSLGFAQRAEDRCPREDA